MLAKSHLQDHKGQGVATLSADVASFEGAAEGWIFHYARNPADARYATGFAFCRAGAGAGTLADAWDRIVGANGAKWLGVLQRCIIVIMALSP